jgi:DNA polymerase phi
MHVGHSHNSADLQVNLRQYAEYISKLINLNSTPLSESEGLSIVGLALKELTALAYSTPEWIPAEAVTSQLKDLCRVRLESAFAKLTKITDFQYLCEAVASIDPSNVALDSEIVSELNGALKRMKKLFKQSNANGINISQGLALLHAVAIFQLYNEDPDAIEVLKDLTQYQDRLTAKTEGASEFLVEILLSMVARPSSLMRQVSQQVFKLVTEHVSHEALALLTDPLAADESAKGQKALFNTEEDDVDMDGEDSDEDESDHSADSDLDIDSDVEFVTLNGDEANENEGSDSGSNNDDNEDDEDEEKGDADEAADMEALDNALAQVLGSHRLDKDKEAESSSDSDADMSDSEMLALDDKLAEVFKHRITAKPQMNKKKANRDAKESVTNFKHRILDLLEIYVKNEAPRSNPLINDTLLPLLLLMRTTMTKVLATRACDIIVLHQKLLKKSRGSNDKEAEDSDKQTSKKPSQRLDDVDEDKLLSLMENIHDEAAKDASHVFARAVSTASLIVAANLFAVDRQNIENIANVYAATQTSWVLGNRIQASFFSDWLNWCQNLASQSHNN